jgi:hypothetical protein
MIATVRRESAPTRLPRRPRQAAGANFCGRSSPKGTPLSMAISPASSAPARRHCAAPMRRRGAAWGARPHPKMPMACRWRAKLRAGVRDPSVGERGQRTGHSGCECTQGVSHCGGSQGPCAPAPGQPGNAQAPVGGARKARPSCPRRGANAALSRPPWRSTARRRRLWRYRGASCPKRRAARYNRLVSTRHRAQASLRR